MIILSACQQKTDGPPDSLKEGLIEVTGGKVWYRIVGADKPGIPLLVLHGGPGAPHDYLVNLEALADERPVIFYDQLGCGNSDRPTDSSLWTTDRFVEEVEQIRTALNLKEFHILGQSWGGFLAASYFLKYGSENVQSIIFSAPLLSSERWLNDQRYWISLLPQADQDTISKYEASGDFTSVSYQEAVQQFYIRHLCRLDPWPEALNLTFQKMGAEVYTYMWGPSEFTITGILKDADLTDQLYKIDVPCLFTCGEFDEARPSSMEFFQNLIPGSELKVFEDASHSHHLEKSEEYLNCVRSFLNK